MTPLPKLTPEEPTTTAITADEAAALLRAAFNLFTRWQVSDGEARILLGEPSPRTFYRWKAGEGRNLPKDTIWRLADLMGVHKITSLYV